MITKLIHLACLFTALLALVTEAGAQTTVFTYQGRLTENGAPANGSNDFTFTLYNAASGGATVGTSNLVNDVAVSNGNFAVVLDYGASAFDGSDRWLQIAVRPGASAAAYTNLVPRQPITATPYAIRALNAGTATTASSVAAGAVTSSGLAVGAVGATAIADGSITSADLNPGLLNNTFWKLAGNVGATPGANFIGTTDYQPLEFKVNNQRGLRLEPTTNTDTVNVIGGSARNSVGAGAVGATIGGGAGDYLGLASTNRVDANFGTVSGGGDNNIKSNADYATIGGGSGNSVGPSASYATIGGGYENHLGSVAQFSTIGGGDHNINAGFHSTIGGGAANAVNLGADYATVPGGSGNTAGGVFSFAAGQRAKANHTGAFVWADATAADFSSTSNNQFLIRAAGGVGINKTNPATALDVNGIVTASGFTGNGGSLTNLNATNLVGVISTAGKVDNSATTATSANTPNAIVARDASGKFSATGLHWSSSAELTDDQGGSMELGDSARAFAVPFIDFHYGVSGNQDYNARLINDANGQLTVVGGLRATGGLVVDQDSQNNGSVSSNSLTFGASSGEGIASKRTGGGNQWGLDFYTSFQPRLTIANNGNVGIGTISPSTRLEVNGAVTATGFSGNGAGLANVNAATFGGLSDSSFWKIGGNAGTAGGSLGTLDSQPMGFLAGGSRALLLETKTVSLPGRVSLTTVNVLGGASINTIADGVIGATIGGGGILNVTNVVVSPQPNTVLGNFGTVGGGINNTAGIAIADTDDARSATVGGGEGNTASGLAATVSGGTSNTSSSFYTTVGGGVQNTSSGDEATVAGGRRNTSSGGSATVAGGILNISSGIGATVGGGSENTCSAPYATVPGGSQNVAQGSYSFAAGHHAKANHPGSFVWSDWDQSQNSDFSSTAENEFSVRAVGGVRFVTQAGPFAPSAGVTLAAGGSAWASISDRAAKKNFQPVDGQEVLEKLARIPVQRWNYKCEDDHSTPHIGPTAQDFKGAFFPGRDDKVITTLEFDGVALAAIQGLNQKLEAEAKTKDARIAALEERLSALEILLQK